MSGLFISAPIFLGRRADIILKRWRCRCRSRFPSWTSTPCSAGGPTRAPIWRNTTGKWPDFMNQKKLDELVDILADEHLRQRIEPRPGDSLYLHLSDLRLALQAHATDAKLDLLDFGAGCSPYRSLFPKANYRRADFAIGTGEGLDFVLNESLLVAAPDNSFDLVLSTQVLEHVEQPENYLKECLRLLRPGGKLVLTTHGIYAAHPCPLDLHRWTADGL